MESSCAIVLLRHVLLLSFKEMWINAYPSSDFYSIKDLVHFYATESCFYVEYITFRIYNFDFVAGLISCLNKGTNLVKLFQWDGCSNLAAEAVQVRLLQVRCSELRSGMMQEQRMLNTYSETSTKMSIIKNK